MSRGRHDLARELERLEDGQLIRALIEMDPSYTFKHNLVQQVAYQSLLAGDRRGLHRAVGETLERLHPEARHELAEVLASHFEQAGDSARALEYLDLAGGQAMRRFATAEASALFSRAIEIAGAQVFDPVLLLHLYQQRGRALELRGDHTSAMQVYQELEELGRTHNDPRLQLGGVIGAASLQAVPTLLFDPAAALANADRALSLASQLGDPAGQAKAYWLKMLVQTRLDPRLAVEAGEASLALARQHGLRDQEAFTLNDIQANYLVLGEPERALAALEQARPIWRELDNLPMLSDNLASTAMVHAVLGEYDPATERSQEAVALSDRIGNLWGQSYGRISIGLAAFARGELGATIREMTRCIEISELAGFLYPQIAMRAMLAFAYGFAGDLDTAEELGQKIRRIEQGSPLPGAASGSATLAWVAARRGDLTGAEVLLQQAGSEPDAMAMAMGDSPIPLALAATALQLAKHDYAAALQMAERFSAALERHAWRIVRCPLLLMRGRALAGLKEWAQAREMLEIARSEMRVQGVDSGLWEVEAELATVTRVLGDPSAASLLASARQRLLAVAEGLRQAGLSEKFLAQPHIRAIFEEAGPAA